MAKKKTVRRRAPARRAPEPIEIDEDTLRDFFAGCALVGLAMRVGIPDFHIDGCDQIAKSAYDYADAMLDAREDEEDDEEDEDEDEDR